MFQYRLVLGLMALGGAALFVADQNANAALQPAQPGGVAAFRLYSPQDGQAVAPFQEISWVVRTFVSPDDNEGLALFAFDFIQDPNNPELFNIPKGDDPITELECFDQPAGFTNPGFKLTETGYGGTHTDVWGARNRRQIGGAQNTFGKVGPCHGQTTVICMGQDVDVDAGIGHGGVTLSKGKFRAPQTPGTYTMHIENLIANTLVSVEVAPTPSPTLAAEIRCLEDTFTFTVQ